MSRPARRPRPPHSWLTGSDVTRRRMRSTPSANTCLGGKQADDQERLARKVEEVSRMRQHAGAFDEGDDEVFLRARGTAPARPRTSRLRHAARGTRARSRPARRGAGSSLRCAPGSARGPAPRARAARRPPPGPASTRTDRCRRRAPAARALARRARPARRPPSSRASPGQPDGLRQPAEADDQRASAPCSSSTRPAAAPRRAASS